MHERDSTTEEETDEPVRRERGRPADCSPSLAAARAVIDLAREPMALIDDRGRVVHTNAEWESTVGACETATRSETEPGATTPGAPRQDVVAEVLVRWAATPRPWTPASAAGGRDGDRDGDRVGDRVGDRAGDRAGEPRSAVVPEHAARLHTACLAAARAACPGEIRIPAHESGEEVVVRLASLPGGWAAASCTRPDAPDDATELRQARRDESRLRKALDSLPFAVWLSGDDGRVIIQNERSRHRWGDVVGVPLDDPGLSADVQELLAVAGRRGRRGKTTRRESRVVVGGEERLYEQVVAPIRGASDVRGAVGIEVDATDHRHSEQELRERNDLERLLFRELDHRVRNNLTALLALVDFSRKRSTTVDELAESMVARISTMAAAHSLLRSSHWTEVSLRQIVRTLADPEQLDRIHVNGDEVSIPARQVTAMGMVVNELLQNARKHGALRGEHGELHVTARRAQDRRDGTRVVIEWEERGGPAVDGAHSPGSGTELISGLLRAELRGGIEFGYPASGVRHRLIVRFDLAYPSDGDGASTHAPARSVRG